MIWVQCRTEQIPGTWPPGFLILYDGMQYLQDSYCSSPSHYIQNLYHFKCIEQKGWIIVRFKELWVLSMELLCVILLTLRIWRLVMDLRKICEPVIQYDTLFHSRFQSHCTVQYELVCQISFTYPVDRTSGEVVKEEKDVINHNVTLLIRRVTMYL